MEVCVTGKATSRWTYSGSCQMVKSFKLTYVCSLTDLKPIRLSTGASTAVVMLRHTSTVHQLRYCSWTVPPQTVAPLLHAMCRLKAPEVKEIENRSKNGREEQRESVKDLDIG